MSANVLIAGAGKIGALITTLLAETGDFQVSVIDRDFHIADSKRLQGRSDITLKTLNIDDHAELVKYCKAEKFHAVISCLPYFCNLVMAEVAAECDMIYLDLTEDVATTEAIKSLAKSSTKAMIPQCGLAPGFVGIATNSLIEKFTQVDTVKMRVGGLPEHASNALHYYLTWSTDGLINEYANPCPAIEHSKPTALPPLQSLETLRIDGTTYEAFNTSGGIGNLVDLYAGRVKTMNYKTIRYPGHCEKMRLLMHELKLQDDRPTLKHILENAVPKTYQDMVIVYISVTGERKGNLFEENHMTKLFPTEIGGHIWSAIQIATASSVCAVLDITLSNKKPEKGFVYQEKITLDSFLENRFGQYYQYRRG